MLIVGCTAPLPMHYQYWLRIQQQKNSYGLKQLGEYGVRRVTYDFYFVLCVSSHPMHSVCVCVSRCRCSTLYNSINCAIKYKYTNTYRLIAVFIYLMFSSSFILFTEFPKNKWNQTIQRKIWFLFSCCGAIVQTERKWI